MKKGVIQILFFALILITTLALTACHSTGSSSTSALQTFPTTTTIVGTSTASSSPATTSTPLTFGAMAALGKTVFKNYGASSHGENGQGGSGPALIGSNASLAKYNTAQGLLNYISASMPLEAPGSLSHQDYLDVLCYLLVQNNYVYPNDVFSESQLSNITLK
jgi:cytochrome c